MLPAVARRVCFTSEPVGRIGVHAMLLVACSPRSFVEIKLLAGWPPEVVCLAGVKIRLHKPVGRDVAGVVVP